MVKPAKRRKACKQQTAAVDKVAAEAIVPKGVTIVIDPVSWSLGFLMGYCVRDARHRPRPLAVADGLSFASGVVEGVAIREREDATMLRVP